MSDVMKDVMKASILKFHNKLRRDCIKDLKTLKKGTGEYEVAEENLRKAEVWMIKFLSDPDVPELGEISYSNGVKDCLAVIESRMKALRAPKTETFRDPASGRSETIEKGEWIGSIYEHELFTELLKDFTALLETK